MAAWRDPGSDQEYGGAKERRGERPATGRLQLVVCAGVGGRRRRHDADECGSGVERQAGVGRWRCGWNALRQATVDPAAIALQRIGRGRRLLDAAAHARHPLCWPGSRSAPRHGRRGERQHEQGGDGAMEEHSHKRNAARGGAARRRRRREPAFSLRRRGPYDTAACSQCATRKTGRFSAGSCRGCRRRRLSCRKGGTPAVRSKPGRSWVEARSELGRSWVEAGSKLGGRT
jgi:hypothetical protein